MEKLQEFHMLFLALGTSLNAMGMGLPATSKAQIWVLASGTFLTAFGGFLARGFQKPEVKAAVEAAKSHDGAK